MGSPRNVFILLQLGLIFQAKGSDERAALLQLAMEFGE